MSTSMSDKEPPEPIAVRVTRHSLQVDLADGRRISVPTEWFPRLFHGSPAEWKIFELSHEGIHWTDLNEDISVEALLRGEKCGESAKSIRRWLGYRARGEKEPILELPMPPDLAKELQKIGVWQTKKTKPRPRRAG